MKKFKVKAITFLVALCMTILPLGSAWGDSPQGIYVALGDSISTGYHLSDIENERFTEQLAQYCDNKLINLAQDGMDTTSMLAVLNSNDKVAIDYKNSIKTADLITLSIGGNNILGTLINTIKTALGLSPNATPEEIAAAMKSDPTTAASKIYAELMKPQTKELLNQGVQRFATDYPQIIQNLKTLNPNAIIMVQTLYNPFLEVPQYKALADLADPFIQGLNQLIIKSQGSDYNAVDVYTAFKNNTTGQMLTNISTFDVHPNALGHAVIFNAHKTVLDSMNNTDNVEIQLIAGESRYTTAIKVSQERFKDGEAKSVILVGKDAVVDGLAASPLAIQEQAPILFTDVNGLSVETITEMKRVLGNDIGTKTIYIIGGEGRISKLVETQLNTLGIKVIDRISGANRYETSIKIATKLDDSYTQAFVVGGNGEADAMSISAKAAQLKAPIVVVDKQTLSEDAKTLLNNKQIEIIGGVEAISENVKSELQTIDSDKQVDRVAGKDRKSTNAMVIAKYYAPGQVKEVYVSKDGFVGGKDKLVDALAAAPLAGSNGAPIILTTGEISKEQAGVISSNLIGSTKLIQIGNGINSKTIELIAQLMQSN